MKTGQERKGEKGENRVGEWRSVCN